MPNNFDFIPYTYAPKFAGGSDPATALSGSTATEGSNSSIRAGSLVTINRDIRLAFDLAPVKFEPNPETGFDTTTSETFMAFPGDGTAQNLVMYLSYAGTTDARGRPTNASQPLPFFFPNNTAFNVRVVQRDPETRLDTVIYPNTRYSQVSGKVDVIEPTASMKSRQPLFLVVVSTLPFITGGIPMPGWNGDGDAPTTPLEFSPLRLHVTMQLLTSKVA